MAGRGSLKSHHVKHFPSPGFTTEHGTQQEWNQEALCHPGCNAASQVLLQATSRVAWCGWWWHKKPCWAPGWDWGRSHHNHPLSPTPGAAVETDTTNEQQHEVGVKWKCLVWKRETRQIWSQRMLQETSQFMKSFWSIINWKLITESWKEHKPKMGQHTFIAQLLTLNLFQ